MKVSSGNEKGLFRPNISDGKYGTGAQHQGKPDTAVPSKGYGAHSVNTQKNSGDTHSLTAHTSKHEAVALEDTSKKKKKKKDKVRNNARLTTK